MRDYEFGNLIFELRKKKKITQSQLGELLGVSNKTVSKWENGISKPNINTLYKLAEYFDISVDDLVSGKLPSESDSSDGGENTNGGGQTGGGAPSGGSGSERRAGSRRNKLFTLLLSTMAIMALVAASVFAIYPFNNYATVPQLVGKSIELATDELNELKFDTEVLFTYSDTVKKNLVVSQNIPAGYKMDVDNKIVITVSAGKELVRVPYLEYLSLDRAELLLSELGFTYDYVEEFSEKANLGFVIGQSIGAGEEVPKGSKVTFTVSKGSGLTKIPNVVGQPQEIATVLLRDAGFKYEYRLECNDTVPDGCVISQDHKAESYITYGSTVTITVSAGVANTVGNTNSNLRQWGRVAQQGEWIYYANTNYDYDLYRMRLDGSEKQILALGTVGQINVVGEWVYYSDQGEGNEFIGRGTYKVCLDGTKKTMLLPSCVSWMKVVGDEIYYVSNAYSSGDICKMKTDGSKKEVIVEGKCGNVNLVDGWLYYKLDGENSVYKIRTDGSNGKKVCSSIINLGTICGEDDYIFISSCYDMYRLSTDKDRLRYFMGESNVQLSFYNYYEGKVYYIEYDMRDIEKIETHFCVMNPDGTGKTRLFEMDPFIANFFINIADGRVYFPNSDGVCSLYRICLDGTDLEEVYI